MSEELVSVILIGESSEEKDVSAALENIFDQTYKNIDLIVTSFKDYTELQRKFIGKSLNIRWVKYEPGNDFIEKALKLAEGSYVFYKTVNNCLWFPRHISAHMEEYKKNPKAKWSLSHVEHRNIDLPDHPLNCIGYRISNPPKVEEVSIDEICHASDIFPDWVKCIIKDPNNPSDILFIAGFVLQQWNEQGLRGFMPPEITVIQWMKTGVGVDKNLDELRKSIGAPERTEIKDDIQTIDGDMVIARNFPTVMGSMFFDEYNNHIKEQIAQTSDIKSIAIKRTVGMGDVILVEPIIKKLKQKYPDAEITLYTSKPDVVDYFANKPHHIETIEESALLKDYLTDKPQQLKYDLDLSYESRIDYPFVDAYAEVCGIEFEDYKDKYVELVIEETGEGIATDKPLAVFCADGSGWPGKTWPIERYAEVIKHLQDKGWRVIETGKYHTDLTDEKYHDCDFKTMMRIISQAWIYVGADNGPMHIARGFNVPCAIIAGAALPYFTNPNREYIFYIQDNSNPGLGIKHRTFFEMRGETISFVPNYEEDPSCGLKYIMPEHVIASLEKMIPLEDGSDFYFNIPGYSYYIDKKIDHIQKGDVTHPDQDKDISEEYAPRWEQILTDHAMPWVDRISRHFQQTIVEQEESNQPKLLDVGCNIGCTVKAALDMGFNAYGIDLNEPSVKKSHDIFPELKDRISHTSEIEGKFDVITSDQVIEHIEEPIEWLKTLSDHLNDDGFIFIGTPNFRSKQGQNEWNRWGQVGTGEHTWLPTPTSLEFFLKEAGLEFEHLEDPYESGGFVIKCWKKK